MKIKIWLWVKKNIFRTMEGEIIPKWWRFLHWIIFPIWAIRSYPNADPRWEPWNDIFIIFGKKYSGDFFRILSSPLSINRKFEIVDNNINQTVILKEIRD